MDVQLQQIRVFSSKNHNGIEDIGSVDESPLHGDQFTSGPCQHNAKFACVFIPCSIPLFYLSGNLILGASTFAVVCLYLVQHASKERRSVIAAFIMCVVALQFVAIYSLLPFVWQSFFNIGLVFIYNVFLVLSGGVGLLQLKQMQIEEPAFTMYLEYILFVAYPITGQFVMTSVSALFIGWWSAPFFCIVYGFLFIQVFLVPSKSSFTIPVMNTRQQTKTDCDVIGPKEKTLLLFSLLTIPGSLFIIINVMNFMRLTTWVQLLACGFFPVFLCTCLNIDDVVNFLNLHSMSLRNVRYRSGVACLAVFTVLFWLNGTIPAQGLRILYPSIIIGLAVGMSAKSSERKKFHQVFLLMLILFYVSTIGSWMSANLPNQMLYALLGMAVLSVLSVTSVWMSHNKLVFSSVMVAQSTGMVLCEFFLLEKSIYSVYDAMLTTMIVTYVMFRLSIVDMINWQATWLCWSIHSSKIPVVFHSLAPQHSFDQGYLWPKTSRKHHSFICAVFSLIVLKLLVFYDDKSVNFKKGVKICCGCAIALLLAYDSLILPVWVILTNQWPSGADIASTVLLLWGLLYTRICYTHLYNNLDAKRLNIVVLCSGVFIKLFQLDFNPIQVTFSLMYFITSLLYPLPLNKDAQIVALQWLLLISFVMCLILVVKLVRLEYSSIRQKLFFSVVIGLPIGLKAASMIFHDKMHPPLAYGASSSFAVYLFLSSWTDFGESSNIPRGFSFVGLLASSIGSIIFEFMMRGKISSRKLASPENYSLRYYLLLFLILSLGLKRQKSLGKGSLEDIKKAPSNIRIALGSSSLANIFVLLSCILAVLLSPGQLWELWLILCGCILLLWRSEGLFWNIPGLFCASVFLVIAMYFGTIMTALPLHVTALQVIGFCTEMVVLHICLPSHLGLIYSLWKNNITLTLQKLAVFSGPVNVVLLVYCSTSCGRIFGIVGICATYWTFYNVECTL